MHTRRWSPVSAGGACMVALGLMALPVSAWSQNGADAGSARRAASAQGARGGGVRPPAPEQTAIAVDGEHVWVVLGGALHRFSAADLKELNQVALPDAGPGDGPDLASGRPGEGGGMRPPRGDRQGQGGGGPQAYSLSQAISNEAQLHTVAFSGLAFLTGDYGACTFLPPGKVCDFFGFQYMRDIDAAEAGHNPKFLDRVVANVLYILTPAQKKALEALARQEAVQMRTLAGMRLPLIKAFCRQRDAAIPAGSPGLNRDAVKRYVGELFAYDAGISYRRAEAFGRIASALTSDQKAYLGKMKFGDFSSWPDLDVSGYKLPRGTAKPINVAYMSCASEFFSWYAGSVEADTYFCPERHGTYFGGFYMKDMPAMGKRDYDISTSVTGDSGRGFLEALSAEQRGPIAAIPDQQRSALNEIVAVRRAIARELRRFRTGGHADQARVLALGRRYGELDGAMSHLYAVAFSRANRTLTSAQRATLVRLRNLDGYTSAPAYIYSDPAPTAIAIPSTDRFFAPPARGTKASPRTSAAGPSRPGAAAGRTFALRSPAIGADGVLPVAFTGDGDSVTPPLEWTGAPLGTRSYALIMHHVDPEGRTKWYWTLYNLPAGTQRLARNVQGMGTCGNNSVNGKVGYAPPHSKGPGSKTYVLTLYALSQPLHLSQAPSEVSREVLLEAMRGRVLGSAELRTVYTRNIAAVGEPAPAAP